MSRDASWSFRMTHQIGNSSRDQIPMQKQEEEANENEFEKPLSIQFPPPRTPLNSIPDPSQCHSDFADSKVETSRPGKLLLLSSATKKFETPRVSNSRRPHSEPNSAQTTPARSASRVSLGGAHAAVGAGGRSGTNNSSKGRDLSSTYTRLTRGTPIENSDFSVQVPHFDLDEDPSFWADHNVQVFIRIRPLSNMEKVSQGYGRCLKQESSQTLVWLGYPETRFTFDHIACETISQEKLFKVVGLPMVENCMSGYNSCIFAYGQTGSGKTYTMLGDINQLDDKFSQDCGITPRIFEYLFSRIKMEEESRRDEKLKFSCKCSFLEIYNEQITDLLEPSSTNLQLREDLRKGVYVENLSEYNVKTVDNVTKLLSQGAANRKIAATNMNSESSRSHSVFTCIIESCWEKDSMSHFRFARLNLVDLAGSERQKSSGSEGDRLKEAANINKSLSTLGLVIMSLVDLAHGKHRHVPYRDSRLTFLLQDSLGGNSKTTIIANISPSMCSAHETLSTLKFAQRAKLIQNNAKVNEDASGDVTTLQRQIQQLKDQLSFLIKHHNLSTSLSNCAMNFEEASSFSYTQMIDSSKDKRPVVKHSLTSTANEKMKCMEATLAGALRREKMAEKKLQKLKAEIEHVNQIACEREEELQQTKTILKLREAKLKHLEFLTDGLLPHDHFLLDENKALKEEILLLKARIDKNPELSRFALENLELLEQLQVSQKFYEQGEREMLLAETSELREQLLDMLERKLEFSSRYETQDDGILEELEECRNMNSKLEREVGDLKAKLKKCSNNTQATFDIVTESLLKDPEELRHSDKYSLVESVFSESDFEDEMVIDSQAVVDLRLKNKHNQKGTTSSDPQKELIDARLLIEEMESEQAYPIKETQFSEKQNYWYMEDLNKKDKEVQEFMLRVGSDCLQDLEKQSNGLLTEGMKEIEITALQEKLEKLNKELEEAKSLNRKSQEDQASRLFHQHQVELICEQVETETTRTILHLQEEVTALRLELNEKLFCMNQENMNLRNIIDAKEEEIGMLCRGWERATFELTSFLAEGSKSLEDASGQVESIVSSFPQVNVWIREHVERAARACIDKEEAILELSKSLEDAQKMVMEMEMKLNSLKEATIALNEFPQSDGVKRVEDTTNLDMLLMEKIGMIKLLESELRCKEDRILEAEKRADAALLVVKWLSDYQKASVSNDIGRGSSTVEEIKPQVGLEILLTESENAINESYMDVEVHVAALHRDILEASTTYMKCIQGLVNEIHEMRCKFMELKENCTGFQSSTIKLQASESHVFQHFDNQHSLQPMRDELAKVHDRLKIIENSILRKAHGHLLMDEYLAEADNWSSDYSPSSYSTLGFDFSNEVAVSPNQLNGLSHTCCSKFSAKTTDQEVDLKFQMGTTVESGSANLKFLEKLNWDEAMAFCLRKELDLAFDAFNKLYAHLTTILDENNIEDISYSGGTNKCFESRTETAEDNRKVFSNDKANHSSTFFIKFEEARATMKEADHMLNALLEANNNAKELNDKWKLTSEQLMVERSHLIEENEQLKASILLKEDNTFQLDEICHGLVEITDSVSSFEGCFRQMQRELDDNFKVLYSDILCMGKEMLHFICNSRSSLEDIFSELMEKEFAYSVMYQCVVGEAIHKFASSNVQSESHPFKQKECHVNSLKVCTSSQDDIAITSDKVEGGEELINDLEKGVLDLSYDNMTYENLSLKKELERKEVLLKGLHFDFSLLQEAASKRKDMTDETEKLILTLSEVRHELEMKSSQFDNLLVQYKKVEGNLVDSEDAVHQSNSDLVHAKERIDTLSEQNAELRMSLKDLYLKKSEAEEQLEEQRELVRGLEREINASSVEKKINASVEGLEEDLRNAAIERDQFCEEICSLHDQLEMAYALADENEAIAVESRQESEARKIYAEQKEEEVKILENSVEELESTINVLEKKVCEMDEEVERHRLIRESLELELQAFRQRMLTVENITDIVDSGNAYSVQNEDPISRQFHNKLLELHAAHNQIRLLERDIAEKDEEIKQCKEHISELILHSEAQASQYQEKYKALEAMVHEVKTNLVGSASATTLDKSEKCSMRTRGSSSPFRCISNLIHQMNLEKDQEILVAKNRIEELEAILASRQKEVCMLNARLAAAESMTHDVIRDLLGVKLDMTNYANLIDQHQVQRLVEAAHQQTEEFSVKEQEILNLRRLINDLRQEKESCVLEINNKAADMLAAQMTLEQVHERDQLLSAQNEMLKTDKTNLLRRVAELDEIVKTLLGTQDTQQQIQRASKSKENAMLKMDSGNLTQRLAHSEKLLSHVNKELAQYRKSSCKYPHFNYGDSSRR